MQVFGGQKAGPSGGGGGGGGGGGPGYKASDDPNYQTLAGLDNNVS